MEDNAKAGFRLLFKSIKDAPWYTDLAKKSVWIHLIIEVGDSDVEVLNVGTHVLAWSAVWIAKTFGPTLQPVLFDGVPRQRGEVVFHVTLEAYRGGKHVAVLGNMPDTFTGGTLDIRQIGTAIPVRAWGSTALARTVRDWPTMLAGTIVVALVFAPANSPTFLVSSPTAGGITIACGTLTVLPFITVHHWRVWGSLDRGWPNIDSADAWACNIPHA